MEHVEDTLLLSIDLPLKQVMIKDPFQEQGSNLIGPTSLYSIVDQTYILRVVNYFTKWLETSLMRQTTFEVICKFTKQNIPVMFAIPQKMLMLKMFPPLFYFLMSMEFVYHIYHIIICKEKSSRIKQQESLVDDNKKTSTRIFMMHYGKIILHQIEL